MGTETEFYCTRQQICLNNFENNDNLRYEINKKQPYYFKNWFEHLNLTCVGSTNVALVISAYFVGYVIGIYLIEMSSKFGRKGALKMILPVYILGSSITVFSQSLTLKALGFFIQGVLHVKMSICSQHILELVPESYKGFSATFIQAFDASSLCFSGLCLIFITNDMVKLTEYVFIIKTIASLIYLTIAPESPYWLVINERYMEAVENLNYIAQANNATERIPSDVQFDLVGQMLRENQTLNETSAGLLHTHLSSSIVQMTKTLEKSIVDDKAEDTQSISVQSAKKDLQTLFFNNNQVFLKSLILFTVSINIFFLTVFNAAQLHGNKLFFIVIFGCSFGTGIAVSQVLIKYMQDIYAYLLALGIILVITLIQYVDSSSFSKSYVVYSLFAIQVFANGICSNLNYIISF